MWRRRLLKEVGRIVDATEIRLTQGQRLPCSPSMWSASRSYAGEAPAGRARGPVSYVSLGITMATGAGLLYYYNSQKEEKIRKLAATPVAVGHAAMGGPFDLIDQNGKKFTDENLKGKFSLLYFGFTHCPDVCPEELEKIAEAVDLIDKKSTDGVQPVFITVDPARDSVKQVAEYVKEFHPRLIGLTGPADKVNAAARSYRVYHSKASTGGDSSDDYLIDHSIITYLLDPDTRFVTFFGKNQSAEEMAASVVRYIEQWKKTHK